MVDPRSGILFWSHSSGGKTAMDLIPEVNDELDDIITKPFSIISYIGATLYMLIIRQMSQWQNLRHSNLSARPSI